MPQPGPAAMVAARNGPRSRVGLRYRWTMAGGPDTGLSSAEASRRLQKLGPPPETSSRSASSIVAGNVFTLFNLILGTFFVIVLALGLFADALFGVIAIVNSYIGIRQEMKAKEVLDQLAVLVAPKA